MPTVDSALCFPSHTDSCSQRENAGSMPREHRYFVYILSSKSRRIYTGVTGDLFRRVMQHKGGAIRGFTQHYKINRLVFYQEFQYVRDAISRETTIKGWLRTKKVALIERENPTWDDLADDWGKPWTPLNAYPQPSKAGSSLRSE